MLKWPDTRTLVSWQLSIRHSDNSCATHISSDGREVISVYINNRMHTLLLYKRMGRNFGAARPKCKKDCKFLEIENWKWKKKQDFGIQPWLYKPPGHPAKSVRNFTLTNSFVWIMVTQNDQFYTVYCKSECKSVFYACPILRILFI